MSRLSLDEDLDPLVAHWRRERGHDVVSAHDLGRIGLPDPDQLAYAAGDGGALLTYTAGQFVPLSAQWWHEGRTPYGIVVARQLKRREIGQLLRLVANLPQLAAEEELTNRLRHLAEFDL